MRIDPSQDVAGVPLPKVQDLLLPVRFKDWFERLESTEIKPTQMKTVLQWLERQEYIRPLKGNPRRRWAMTTEGRFFAEASSLEPLPRGEALSLLDGFLERCRSLRQPDSPYVYVVQEAILFGSLLDENRSTVNDIDLCVVLRPKPEHWEEEKYKLERSMEPMELTVDYLRGETVYFHFNMLNEPIFDKDIPKKVLYQDGVEQTGGIL